MRTTLIIDDDILAAATQLAERDRKTIGQVISALARQGLAHGAHLASAERNGIPLLPSRRGSTPVTPERVGQLIDLMGTLEWDASYDHGAERSRKWRCCASPGRRA